MLLYCACNKEETMENIDLYQSCNHNCKSICWNKHKCINNCINSCNNIVSKYIKNIQV